eukprot:gene6102-7069_t
MTIDKSSGGGGGSTSGLHQSEDTNMFQEPFMRLRTHVYIRQMLAMPLVGLVSRYLMIDRKRYSSSSIARRANLLLILCLIYVIVYLVCMFVSGRLLPFFGWGIAAMFIVYLTLVRTNRYFVSTMMFIGLQTALYISASVYYYTIMSSLEHSGTDKVPYIFLANFVCILITTSILFPQLVICGSVLLVLSLLNSALNLFLYYKCNVDKIIVFHMDLKEKEEREDRIRCLFNISSEALVVVRNGMIEDANATFEKMFQVKVGTIINPVPCAIWEFLPDIEKHLRSMDTNSGNIIDTIGINSSGEDFSVEVRVDRANHLSAHTNIVSIIDTSARKKLMEADLALRKAEAINEAKINFLTTVSHEVRTPINGILASVEIVEKTQLDYTQRDFLNTVEFNLITMLEETMNIVYRTAQEKGLEMLLMVEDEVPIYVIGDPYRVKQILLNFLSNSIKFTSTGQVIVRVKLHGSTTSPIGSPILDHNICFEVQDSGLGIREEQIDNLFTAFLQVCDTRKYAGTGLGLSISKQLCRLMGGDIGVTSKYGQGSTFFFTTILQSKVAWTFGSLGNALSLVSANRTMIHTNNEQFVSQRIKGYVYDANPHVVEAAIDYFRMLKVEMKPLSSEAELAALFSTPTGMFAPNDRGIVQPPSEQGDIFIIVAPDCDALTEAQRVWSTVAMSPLLIYWVVLTDRGHNSLRKPIQLPSVVECLYQLQRIPVPQDLHFLLTNNKQWTGPLNTSRLAQGPNADCNPAGKTEKRKALHHHRNSSYSDHVAITRGLIQVNRSPRPTIGGEECEASHSFPTCSSPPDCLTRTRSFSFNAPATTSSSLIAPDDLRSAQTNIPTPNGMQQYHVAIDIPSPSLKPKKSPKMQSAFKSPTLSPAMTAVLGLRNPTVPSLDLDAQKEDFSRKSRSSMTIDSSPRFAKSALFRILLVEDNAVNVKVFSKFLKDGGYQVDVAWNGQQGVDAYARSYYPIIFMDCQMPEMDGYQATEIIRAREHELLKEDKRYRKSFIIALTANVGSSERDRCFEVGMSDFVQKPLRNSSLLLKIIDKYLKNFTEDDLMYLATVRDQHALIHHPLAPPSIVL